MSAGVPRYANRTDQGFRGYLNMSQQDLDFRLSVTQMHNADRTASLKALAECQLKIGQRHSRSQTSEWLRCASYGTLVRSRCAQYLNISASVQLQPLAEWRSWMVKRRPKTYSPILAGESRIASTKTFVRRRISLLMKGCAASLGV